MRRRASLTEWERSILDCLTRMPVLDVAAPRNHAALFALGQRGFVRLISRSRIKTGMRESWQITPEGLAVARLY